MAFVFLSDTGYYAILKLMGRLKKAFASRNFFPKYSAVAVSGIALITNSATPLHRLTYEEVVALLSQPFAAKDTAGHELPLRALLDKNNSSVVRYLADSLLKGGGFSPNCNSLGSALGCIDYVAKNKNTVAFIDFAWLSDVDDSIYKANRQHIKFLQVSRPGSAVFEYPSQSSFKLGTYAFARSICVYRKTGDFTLAKGFESFVAGPKGQLLFLKQGLLPTRQGERGIHVNTKSPGQE